MITHSCGAEWTGAGRAHCSSCHRTYSSETAFQRHRKAFECLDPEEVGLVMTVQPWGEMWGFPAAEEKWWQ